MCGIIARVSSQAPLDRELFGRQIDALYHRGPDDSGAWFSEDGRCCLGSRRLAIQDLTPGGHMPMGYASGALQIVFNGEIYNFPALKAELASLGHRFLSGSDTEVVLASYLQWGTECLDRLNGMFAFALLDRRAEVSARGRIFLARDRTGEKPLYYRHHAHGFECASELKALMADPAFPRRLDPAGLNMYLGLGYLPGEQCILAGVKKLLPAHAALLDLASNDLKVWRYWQLSPPTAQPEQGRGELVEELESLLLASVRRMLVADVPVGVLLSGGVDSSLVTAAAARVAEKPLKTFTIGFPGQGGFDERGYARQVARHFGTEHIELSIDRDFVDLLPRLAVQFDEPLADSSLLPTFVVSELTRRHVTVALAGDGGDELFGGYQTYHRGGSIAKFLRLPAPVRRVIAQQARTLMPLGLRGRQSLSSIQGSYREQFVDYTMFLDASVRQRLISPELWQGLEHDGRGPELYRLGQMAQDMTPVDSMTRADFATYLPDDILTKTDRASMAASLELRVPFLDRELLEFAFCRVPAHLKVAHGERKMLLRLLAQRMLPHNLDITRKQGFSLPPSIWQGVCWDALVQRAADEVPAFLDRRFINALCRHKKNGLAVSGYLFALVMFQLWFSHYRIELG